MHAKSAQVLPLLNLKLALCQSLVWLFVLLNGLANFLQVHFKVDKTPEVNEVDKHQNVEALSIEDQPASLTVPPPHANETK